MTHGSLGAQRADRDEYVLLLDQFLSGRHADRRLTGIVDIERL
jgi:hypothetical protein